MSRVGRKPVTIPEGVTVTITGQDVVAKGANGELRLTVNPKVSVSQADGVISVEKASTDRQTPAIQGLTVRLLGNLVTGVSAGFTKKLEINGVGYRAAVQGKTLVLNVGYSHPVELVAPEGIEVAVAKNVISISGADRQHVGQFAAEIRRVRPPEPYKGKGIKYADEQIRRKAGKAAKAAGA